MLSHASRFHAPKVKMFNKEAIGVRRFCDEVTLRRAGSKLPAILVRHVVRSIIYQTLRETPLYPHTGKVDETMSELYITLVLAISLTKPLIPN